MYQAAAKTMRNMWVMRVGGTQSRSGSTFVAEVKDSSKTVRLIPFVFNNTQTYVLEFGNQYMRVHKNGVLQTNLPQPVLSITNANPAVVSVVDASLYANGQSIVLRDIRGPMSYLNNREFAVANRNLIANTFELRLKGGVTNVNSTNWGPLESFDDGFGPQVANVANIYELSVPNYTEARLPNLNWAQSADVLTITCPSLVPSEFSRTADTSWTETALVSSLQGPTIGKPTISSISASGGAATFTYQVSAFDNLTGEEGLPSDAASTINSAAPTSSAPHTINWGAVTGADLYYVYQVINGQPGFIGFARGTSFVNIGYTPDFRNAPLEAHAPFSRTNFRGNNGPRCVCFYQQRSIYGGSNSQPETLFGSQTGLFRNFGFRMPSTPSDGFEFTLASAEVNQVFHVINNNTLIALTSGGAWDIEGDDSGIIGPGRVNARQKGEFGACEVRPQVINGHVLYLDASRSIIRDIYPKFETTVDRTDFSAHLFDGYTFRDMAVSKAPNPIVWAVRSDGTLLGITHSPQQEIFGWTRHDTDGVYEQVCAVPEGQEWFLYVVVRRTINGQTRRFIERFNTRQITHLEDFKALDSMLSYDGRNTNTTHTMTLSGGTNWTSEELLTLTSSTSFFASSMVGQEIHLTGTDGLPVRFRIANFTSATVVTGYVHRTVTVANGLRGAARSNWKHAIRTVTGLWHLEGKQVAVLADGFVVASPNNSSYATVTVTNGTVTLDKCYAVIHVGLPFTCDFETLDIDSPSGQTLAPRKKLIRRVHLQLENSRGLWLGGSAPTGTDPLENLVEMKLRSNETYDQPTRLFTGKKTVEIQSSWNSNGRIFIRQVDPLPFTLLSVTPEGEVEGGR